MPSEVCPTAENMAGLVAIRVNYDNLPRICWNHLPGSSMKRLLLLIPTFAISLPALADRSEYHECLLQYLEGVESPARARIPQKLRQADFND